MRSMQKVVIQRAEGETAHYTMERREFTGDRAEEQANQWLHEIARTAPSDGSYDKTDVWVTFSTGQEVGFRFDVQHASLPDNDTNLRRHVRAWFLFLCRPGELPHIAAIPERLERAKSMVTPETKAVGESMVALLDADLAPSPAPAPAPVPASLSAPWIAAPDWPTVVVGREKYNLLVAACEHAAISVHHPACKCKGAYSANPERYCTCHVQKARLALDADLALAGKEVSA